MRKALLAVILAFVVGMAPLEPDEPAPVEIKVGGQTVKLVLTGSAVRTKRFLKIYSIASYVEQRSKIRTAEDMLAANQTKQLRLVMLRTVDGPSMAAAFTEVFRINHPEPAFNQEVEAVSKILEDHDVKHGDAIWFTHIPKVGFECKTADGMTYTVRSVEFSRAVWGNYFDKHNVGESIKKDLLGRLPKM